jgi:predicted Zn-dependent protease
MPAVGPATGLILGLLAWLVTAVPAAAITLLRDADIEHGLSVLSAGVLRAAGLNPTRVRVLVVDDSRMNAFVVDNSAIYIHSGLILKVGDAAALQAVIAHEAAHIANGHLARRMGNLRHARNMAGLGAAVAAAAAMAGAGQAAGGIAVGTASSAMRSFLKHTRAEEASADRSALSYLRQAGIDPQGMVTLHEVFEGQLMLSVDSQDPYMQSHPLTRDRITAARAYADAAGQAPPPDPDTAYRFARMRGKLSAFERPPAWTMARADEEADADIRLMRLAVAHLRLRDLGAALAAIDGALALRPEDAFYHDLKGQILMENRKWQAAVDAYRMAHSLAPRDALIRAEYGRALLAAGHPRDGLTEMEAARSRDSRDPRLLRDMAIAYAGTGQTGMAALVTAERYALEGRMDDAGLHARRAVALLPTGSVAWQRAQDVLIASEQFAKGRKKR